MKNFNELENLGTGGRRAENISGDREKKERLLAHDLEEKLNTINNFQATGDIRQDVDRVLALTGVLPGEAISAAEMSVDQALSVLRKVWQELHQTPADSSPEPGPLTLINEEIQKRAIVMVDRTLNYYLNQFSEEL